MITNELKLLIERLDKQELTEQEVLDVLKGVERRQYLKNNVAFFGNSTRLDRILKGDKNEIKAAQQFLSDAFKLYYKNQ